MSFFDFYTKETIATGLVILVVVFLRLIVTKAVKSYSRSHTGIEKRTNLVIKYIHLLISILAIISLIVIWGVQKDDILITLSSIATVVGVAMFAQWSILSNITSGIILFFSFPFKIGDIIKVHDKDFNIEAEIIDINAFHTDLLTQDGERIVYPNNLLLQKGISIIKPKFEDKEFMD
ncbi:MULTISPECIES: mechanosensitive ion channel domain-containing protein [unclassified Flavobacterium]|uniref:mechanosensitive ion channel domain-containing protein n=1 Tax=unclassified Flavobacterium TaxID=196869 RepID=UPI000EB343CA|nr:MULTISPECIES: mechanosensitive ion channel domain-containing protein [unclassified Flavobacterium]RKS02562.1 mechanosensitive ion channel-like protein [Flavobacterium sp. 102]